MEKRLVRVAMYRKRIATIFVVPILVAAPAPVAAAVCSQKGLTVVFVNGIHTNLERANQSLDALSFAMKSSRLPEKVHFHLGYNETHLAGLGDKVQSLSQAFSRPISQYDLKTILAQIHPEVTTQKILLVGHSQGSFYVNEIYDYLVSHGVPKESIGVYQIATPASFVAGGGQYVTSKNDKLVNQVREAEINGNLRVYADSHYLVDDVVASALRANIEIPPEPGYEESDYGGHGFDVYMGGAGDRIVNDISAALARLKTVDVQYEDGCFTPPDADTTYKLQAAALAVADPLLEAAASSKSKIGDDIFSFLTSLANTRGIGLRLLARDNAEITSGLRRSQVAAPVVAVAENVQPQAMTAVESGGDSTGGDRNALLGESVIETEEDAVEDGTQDPSLIVEDVPIIPQLFEVTPGFGGGGGSSQPDSTPVPVDITPPATTTVSVTDCSYSLSATSCLVPSTSVTLSWFTATDTVSYGVAVDGVVQSMVAGTSGSANLSADSTSALSIVSYDAAGNTATSSEVSVTTVTRPLIINEIGWAGIDSGSTQWIEIKNRSGVSITLDSVVLQKNGTDLATLAGTVPAGTLLVVEQTSAPFSGLYATVDPFTSLSTSTADKLSIVWNGVSIDETPDVGTCSSWCAGSKAAKLGSNVSGLSDLYSPLSMERVSDSSDGSLASSWRSTDSYAPYFSGTGKLWGTPGNANSSGLPDAGVYCGSATNLAVNNSSFSPSGGCVYLSKFVTGWTFGARRAGGLYRGAVSSSTQVTSHAMGKSLATITTDNVPSDAVAGEEYFFAIWEDRTFASDTNDFNFYFTQGASTTLGITGPPHGNYLTIPWTYSP